jgi:hypothetical protein
MMVVMTVVITIWWGIKWRKQKYIRHSLKILPILQLPPSPSAAIAPGGLVLLNIEASRPHSDTTHLVGLLWTSDQPYAETSTRQHTTITTDRHPCPRRDSNPQSQQARGRKSTS